MKNKTLIIITLVHCVIAFIGISMLPDTIPAHYSITGEIDRMGSRFELLLLPAITTLLNIIFLYFQKRITQATTRGENGTKYVSLISSLVNLLFLILTVLMIAQAYLYTHNDINVSNIVKRFLIPSCGLLFILLGNYLPKFKNNGIIGLRTTWSMHNDLCWYHSQRLGGIAFMLLGFFVILVLPFFDFGYQLILFLFSTLIVTSIATYGSYRIYLKYKDQVDLR